MNIVNYEHGTHQSVQTADDDNDDQHGDILSRTDREVDGVFLCNVGGKLLGGNEGPWTTGISLSLSSPKLVINSTTPGADTPGDLDLDRDDDILQQTYQ